MTQRMNMDNHLQKEVDLVVPVLPEMVRVVRLTVSGIASTVGFDIDVIEDIKVAVAEICNKLIMKSKSIPERYIIKFTVNHEGINVRFLFENKKPKDFKLFDQEDVFGVSIVNALVDEVEVNDSSDDNEIISLSVLLKGSEV